MRTEQGRTVQRAGLMAKLLSYRAVVPMSCLFLLLYFVTAFAGGGDVLMTYPDVQFGAHIAKGFVVDPNGDVIITGYRDTNVNDYYTIKFNGATGAIAPNWPIAYNSPFNNDDQALAVAVDTVDAVNPNSIIVTGKIRDTTNNDFDIHTIKYKSDGSAVLWQHTFDAGSERDEYPKAIAIDSNSNVYIAGRHQEGSGVFDYLIVKYDVNGNLIVDANWPLKPAGCANCEDWILDIDAVYDGSISSDVIVVTGKSQNGSNYDSRTIKYRADGTQIWQKVHAGTGSSDDEGVAVRLDAGANVIVAGTEKNTTKDIFVIKYSSAAPGTDFWSTIVPANPLGNYQVFDGGASDETRDLWVDSAGAIYVTGSTIISGVNKNIYTAKFTDGGTSTVTRDWYDIFNYSASNEDDPRAIAVDENGDVYVTGTFKDKSLAVPKFDFLTIKYKKASGSVIWSKTYDGVSNLIDETFGIGFSSLVTAGDVIVGGHREAAVTGYDFYGIKYDYGTLDRPTNLQATVNANDKIDLVWDDNSSEVNFELQRCAAVAGSDCPGADYTALPLIAADVTGIQDTGLNADTQYYYRIRACTGTCSVPGDFSEFSNDTYAITTVVSYIGPVDTFINDYNGFTDHINAIDTLSVSAGLHPVVTGYIKSSAGNKDFYTVMLDRANLSSATWSRKYDDPSTYDNEAFGIAVDSDDNVIVTGYSRLFSSIKEPIPPGEYTNDFYTIRYDTAGTEYWYVDEFNVGVKFDGSSAAAISDDYAIAVVATAGVDPADDNIIVLGYGNLSGNEDIYLLKYDPAGSIIWGPVILDTGDKDYPTAMAVDASGDIFITGRSFNGTDYDFITVKYQGSDGALMWPLDGGVKYRTYAGGNGDDKAWAIAVNAAGDVYVTGESGNAAGNRDFYTIKYLGGVGLGNGGTIEWEKRLDSLAGDDDIAVSIAVDPVDGSAAVAGTTVTTNGDNDYFITRYRSTDGAFVWTPEWRILDRPGTNDEVTTMAMDLSGNIHVSGDSTSYDPFDGSVADVDVISVWYDHKGSFVSGTRYQDASETDQEHASVSAVNMYGEAFVGGESQASGSSDYLVMKIEGARLQVPIPFTAVVNYATVDFTFVDNSEDEDSFRIERKTGTCPYSSETLGADGAVTIFDAALPAMPWRDDNSGGGLSTNTDYCYRIRTEDATIGWSRWVEMDVHTNETVAPAMSPSVVLNTTEVELTWQDKTTSENLFNLERRCVDIAAKCPAPDNFDWVEKAEPYDPTGLAGSDLFGSYIDETACEDTDYEYRVNAEMTDAPGWTSGYSNIVSATTSAKAAPTLLNAARISEVEVELNWIDNTTDETGYRIERCTGSGCTPVSPPKATMYPHSLLMHMDEPAGTWNGTADEVVDSSGNKNHGTALNGLNTTTDGTRGQVALFDGSNDRITVPHSSSLEGSGDFTLEMWINPTDRNTWQGLISKASYRYMFAIEDEGSTYRLGYYASGWVYSDTNTIPYGSWTHVAVVYNGTNAVTFYVNGVADGTKSVGTVQTSTADLLIGWWSSNYYFKGKMDDVAVYDRAVPAAEIFDRFSGVTNKLRYSDKDPALLPDTTYRYKVIAFKTQDANCPDSEWTTESNISGEVETTLYGPDTLDAVTTNTTRIDLTWNDRTASETGFTIQRRCSAGVGCPTAFADIATVGPDISKYADTTVCTDVGSARTYEYQVRADKTAATGWPTAWSNTDSDSITAVSGPSSLIEVVAGQTNESQIELQWTNNTTDETGFVLERCKGDAAACSTFTIETPPGAFTVETIPSNNELLLTMDEPRWDGDAGEVIDESGSAVAYHGTAAGGATTTSIADGKFGRAGSFDGSNDYVSTPLNIDQGGSKSYTFEAWAYPISGGGTEQHVISSDNGSYDWALLRYGSEWHVYTGATRIDLNIGITLNDWQHIAAVFIPGTGVRVYKNGTEYTTTSMSTTSADSPITIGRRAGTSAYYFAGRIDDAAVYDRALSKDEITARYERGITNIRKYLDDTDLDISQAYTYRVKAYKNAPDPSSMCSAGRWDTVYSSTLTVGTDAPLPPDELTATAVSSTDVDLTWKDHTMSEDRFEVQRMCVDEVTSLWCPSGGESMSYLYEIAGNDWGVDDEVLTFTDDKACYGTKYEYQVRAERDAVVGPPVITAWETAFSATASDTTDGFTDPDTLVATKITETQIDLTWKDRTDDETGFKIERCLYVGPDPAVDCADPGDYVELVPPLYTLDSVLTLHMDEAAGSWNGTAGEVKDASGNTNNGRRYGGAQVVAGGKYINAATFDGSGDYIEVPDDDSLDLTTAGSIEVWAWKDTQKSYQMYVTKNKTNAYQLMDYSTTGRIAVRWGSDGNNLITDDVVPTGSWQHIVATYDGSFLRVYIQGSLSKEVPYTTDAVANTSTVRIGARSDGYWFDGLIDEAVIYDYALTLPEVQQRFKHGAQNYDPALLTDFSTRNYSDTGLSIANIYYYRVYAYKDKTCDNCCVNDSETKDNSWETGFDEDNEDTDPPAPTDLRLVSKGTQVINLAWNDNTTGEDGFELQRCRGTVADCDTDAEFLANADFQSINLFGQDIEAYQDVAVCQNVQYHYRVRAELDPVAETWVSPWSNTLSVSTDPAAAPDAPLNADVLSEQEIHLYWTESVPDETGFKIRRCEGSSACGGSYTFENSVVANILQYYDKGVPTDADGIEYTYDVVAYRAKTCDNCCNPPAYDQDNSWESSAITATRTTKALPTAAGINMQADTFNTTQIDLYWDDLTGFETGYVLKKCENGVDCPPSTVIANLPSDTTEYSDSTDVCHSTGYTYQVEVANEGVSNHGGGCWLYKIPLTINNFENNYQTLITIPYDSHASNTHMETNFSDIRFYDSVVNAELSYWIESKTDGTAAEVYIRTFSHNEDPAVPGTPTIYMYYGNSSAASSSDPIRTFDYYNPENNELNTAFVKQGNVLSRSGTNGHWDDWHVYNPSVIMESDTSYKMWYSGNSYVHVNIGYATSANGTAWSKDGSNPVLSKGSNLTWDDYHVAYPTVVRNQDNSGYRMWYSGYDGSTWRIGYATSSDGVNWTKYPGNSCTGAGSTGDGCIFDIDTSKAWEDIHVAYPEVIRESDGSYSMWYSGYSGSNWRIGYATSTDGITWSRNASYVLDRGGYHDRDHVLAPSVIKETPGLYRMWYACERTRYRVCYAYSSDGTSWTKYNGASSSPQPVIALGGGGQWDDYHASFVTVVRDTYSGYYKMWYSGSDQYKYGIGLAQVRPRKINLTPPEPDLAAPLDYDALSPDNEVTEAGTGIGPAGCTSTFANGWGPVSSLEATDTTDTPVTPVLTLTVVDDSKIDLNWTETPANTDETRYEVERCETADGACYLTPLPTSLPVEATLGPDAISYSDSGLSSATEYEYLVRVYKDADCVWSPDVESNQVSATTSPNAPILDAVTPLNSLVMKIDWTDQSDNEDGFEVWRAIWGGTFIRIAIVGPSGGTGGAVTYNDSLALEPQTTYTYKLRSFKGTDVSDFSNEKSNTMPPHTTGDSICSP